jgi:hypothetical protein
MKRFALVLTLVVALIFSQGVCQRSVAELISVHLDGTVNTLSGEPFTQGDLFSGYFTYDSVQQSQDGKYGKYDALSLGFSIGDYSWSLLTCKKGRIVIFHNTSNDHLVVSAGNYYNWDNSLDGPFIEGMKYGQNFSLTDYTHKLFSALDPNHTNDTVLGFPKDPSVLEGHPIYWGFASNVTQTPGGTFAEGFGTIIAAGPATPSELAKHLINTVICLMLPKNVENSYLANLKKVPTFIDTGKNIAAINQLTAFIKKVQQDIGHGHINGADGNNLIIMANQLIGKIQP